MPAVVRPERVAGRVLAGHRGEARQGEDGQEVAGRLVQGDDEGAGVRGAQARDAAGLSGAERCGAGDEIRVLLPVRGGLFVVEPLDGGDEILGDDLAVDRGAVADPWAQGEGVGALVGRELIAAGDVGDRDGLPARVAPRGCSRTGSGRRRGRSARRRRCTAVSSLTSGSALSTRSVPPRTPSPPSSPSRPAQPTARSASPSARQAIRKPLAIRTGFLPPGSSRRSMRRSPQPHQRLALVRRGRGRRVGRRPRPAERAGGPAGRSGGRLRSGTAVVDPPGRGGDSRQEQGGDRQADDQAIRAVRRPRCRGGCDLLVGVEPGSGIHGRLGLEEPPGVLCRRALGGLLRLGLLVGLVGGRLVVDPGLALQDALVRPGQGLAGAQGRDQRGQGGRDGQGPGRGTACRAPAPGWLCSWSTSCVGSRPSVRPGGVTPRSPRRAGLPLAFGEALLAVW